jgi:hypothetical protein
LFGASFPRYSAYGGASSLRLPVSGFQLSASSFHQCGDIYRVRDDFDAGSRQLRRARAEVGRDPRADGDHGLGARETGALRVEVRAHVGIIGSASGHSAPARGWMHTRMFPGVQAGQRSSPSRVWSRSDQ